MRLLNAIHRYDVSMFSRLMNVRIHNYLTRSCRYLSKTADGELYILIMALLAWNQGIACKPLLAMLLAFNIERPVYYLLKNGLRRSRPQQVLQNYHSVIRPSDQFSFPSGHTSAAFMMATLIGNYYPILTLPLYLWSGLIGFSRVVLGVHFPTDTLVGSIMGISIGLFSIGQVG